MTYLSDRAQSRRKKYAIGTTLVLLVLWFGWVQIRSFLYPRAEGVISTTFLSMRNISTIPQMVTSFFTSRTDYEDRIKNLELRTEELENTITLLSTSSSTFAMQGSELQPSVVLYPLVRDITTLYSTILLSKGFKDDIAEQSIVYVRGRQPVCIIEEVHAKSSLCKLLSAPHHTVEAVTSVSQEHITLTGQGGGSFIANVPRESKVTLGEKVLLEQDQTMSLGEVVDITSDAQDVFVRVFVRGAYNPVTSSTFYVDKE